MTGATHPPINGYESVGRRHRVVVIGSGFGGLSAV